MHKKKIKMAALDMDDTLLMPDKSIHPDSIRDIEAASANGIHVVYCSGRSVAELRPYVKQLSCMRYAVCMSGAVVYDFKEEKTLFSRAIPAEYVKKIVAVAEEYKGMLQFLTDKASIVSEADLAHMADFQMEEYQETFDNVSTPVSSMADELEHHEAVPKVNIFFRTADDREQGHRKLSGLPLAFAYAVRTSLEMNAEGVTKASGLQSLCDYLGITMDEVMGIGDSYNDRDFLEAVGLSVAMGNAVPEIREICDEVTGDCGSNGVGMAIRRFCGG